MVPILKRGKMNDLANKHGATIWELLVYGTLIAIVYAGAIQMTWIWQHSLLYAQVHTICMLCNYARQCALHSLAGQTVFFDIKKNSCRYGEIEEKFAPGIYFGTASTVYGPPRSPTKIVQKPVTFVGEKMVCYPSGIMQSGALYLTDCYKRATYAISNAVSTVSHMRIYRWNGKKWDFLS